MAPRKREQKSRTSKRRRTQEDNKPKPHWEHDCNTCKYLGTITSAKGTMLDLYIHFDKEGDTFSTIQRYGNDPSDNASWSGEGHQPLLYHLAQQMAYEQGHLVLVRKCSCPFGDLTSHNKAPHQCRECGKDAPFVKDIC